MIDNVHDIPLALKFIRSGMKVNKSHSRALRKIDIAIIIARSILQWAIIIGAIYLIF